MFLTGPIFSPVLMYLTRGSLTFSTISRAPSSGLLSPTRISRRQSGVSPILRRQRSNSVFRLYVGTIIESDVRGFTYFVPGYLCQLWRDRLNTMHADGSVHRIVTERNANAAPNAPYRGVTSHVELAMRTAAASDGIIIGSRL